MSFADMDFSTMRVVLTALSVVLAATATASFDYAPEGLSSEFSFVPLDRVRRSPVEETPVGDPSPSLEALSAT